MSDSRQKAPTKEMFGFRADARLARQIREYSEEEELSESDALRELVENGLKMEDVNERLDELEVRLKMIETATDS